MEGDAHSGREAEQLNGYWKEYDRTSRVSLASKADVSDSGVDRLVRLFIDDLDNPLATMILHTGVDEDGYVFYDTVNPEDSDAAHPAAWSSGEVLRYFSGQLEGVRAMVNNFADAMPGDVADMFRSAIFGTIGYQ